MTLEQSLHYIKRLHHLNHDGRDRMLQYIREDVIIHDIVKKIVDFGRRCVSCSAVNKGNTVVPMKPIISFAPGERIVGDLKQMPLPSKDFLYVLVIVDHFTKYCWLFPLATKHAKQIAEHFKSVLDDLIQLRHQPKIIHTDNGREFKNTEIETLAKAFCTEDRKVSTIQGAPYHPQSQGAVERKNQTMFHKLLKKSFSRTGSNDNWSDFIQEVMACENAAVTTHGMKPFELLRKEKLDGSGAFSYQDWALMCHRAREKILSRADKVQAKHASVNKITTFQVGDKVGVDVQNRGSKRMKKKFEGKWGSTAVIVSKLSGNNYGLRFLDDVYDDKGKIKFPKQAAASRVFNARNLKRIHDPTYDWDSIIMRSHVSTESSLFKTTSKPMHVWGETLWDNDQHGCYVDTFLMLCVVVKHLGGLTHSCISRMAPFPRLVFMSLPSAFTPEELVQEPLHKFLQNKAHKLEVRRVWSEVFEQTGAHETMSDGVVTELVTLLLMRSENEEFTTTDECAHYTESVLWFNKCVLLKSCTKCHTSTSTVSNDMLEQDGDHKFWFTWDREQRSKAADESVFLTFLLRNFHDGVVGKQRRCPQHLAVESASQRGQSVQQLCKNREAHFRLQLSEGLGKFVVIRCNTTLLSRKELTLKMPFTNTNTWFEYDDVPFQLVAIIAYADPELDHFVTYILQHDQWWLYNDLEPPVQRLQKVDVTAFTCLDQVYLFARRDAVDMAAVHTSPPTFYDAGLESTFNTSLEALRQTFVDNGSDEQWTVTRATLDEIDGSQSINSNGARSLATLVKCANDNSTNFDVYCGNAFFEASEATSVQARPQLDESWSGALDSIWDTATAASTDLLTTLQWKDTVPTTGDLKLLVPLLVGNHECAHYVLLIITATTPWVVEVADPLGAGPEHETGHWETVAKKLYLKWVEHCCPQHVRDTISNHGGLEDATCIITRETTSMPHQEGGTTDCLLFVIMYMLLIVKGVPIPQVIQDTRCNTEFMRTKFRPYLLHVLTQHFTVRNPPPLQPRRPPDNRVDVQNLLYDLNATARSHGIGFVPFALSFPSPVKWSEADLLEWVDAGCAHADKVAPAVQQQLEANNRCCVLLWEDLPPHPGDTEGTNREISAHVSLLFITDKENMVIVWDDPFVRHNPTGMAVERLRQNLGTRENNYVVVNVFGTQALTDNDCVQRVASRLQNFSQFKANMERTISRSVVPGKQEKTPKPASKTKSTPTTSARKKTFKRAIGSRARTEKRKRSPSKPRQSPVAKRKL